MENAIIIQQWYYHKLLLLLLLSFFREILNFPFASQNNLFTPFATPSKHEAEIEATSDLFINQTKNNDRYFLI